MVWREAVTLDWRLLGRSRQRSSGELWAVIGLAVMAVTFNGEASLRLGEALAARRIDVSQAPLILGLQLWTAFVAAFAFVLFTGQLSFMRRLLADFSLRPVSRPQAFFTLQAISAAGRHSLVLFSPGLPLVILLGTWLDGTALVAALGATWLMMRLPVGMLTIGARLASASMTVALVTTLILALICGALWLTAPDLLLAGLPPFLVARILTNDAVASAWIGLVTWTLVLAAIEFGSMTIESAPVPSAASAVQPHRPLPAAIERVAALTGCSPVLLHGELLRLSRWRRYQFSWLLCAVLVAILGMRLPHDAGLLRVAIFLMVPAHVGATMLANQFAVDRAGFLAIVMSPITLGAVMRAKVIATLLFTLIAALASGAVVAASGIAWPAIAAGVMLGAGLFAWTAAVGTLTSVLFPSASDPHAVGGSLVNTSAAIAISVGSALYIGPALRVAYLFDAGRVTPQIAIIAGVGLIALAAAALMAVFRVAPRLGATRIEAMVAALTANLGTRT